MRRLITFKKLIMILILLNNILIYEMGLTSNIRVGSSENVNVVMRRSEESFVILKKMFPIHVNLRRAAHTNEPEVDKIENQIKPKQTKRSADIVNMLINIEALGKIIASDNDHDDDTASRLQSKKRETAVVDKHNDSFV